MLGECEATLGVARTRNSYVVVLVVASLTALVGVTTLAVPLLGAVKLGARVEILPATAGDGVKTGLFFKRKRTADICFHLDVWSRGVIRGTAELLLLPAKYRDITQYQHSTSAIVGTLTSGITL